MEQLKIVVIGIVLLASIFKTDAIQCYTCNGTLGSDCAMAVPGSMNVRTCEGNSVCHYVDTLIENNDSASNNAIGERIVFRGCSQHGSDFCDIFSAVMEVVYYCHTCETDVCNVQVTE